MNTSNDNQNQIVGITSTDMIDKFNLLYFNITNGMAPGLSNNEVYYYLNVAQEKLVRSLYNSFESNEQNRKYLNPLVKTYKGIASSQTGSNVIDDKYHTIFQLPSDCMYITYEWIENGNNTLEVIPVTQDEYHRIKHNPFRGADNKRALRLDHELIQDSYYSEIVSENDISDYQYGIRYVKFPDNIDNSNSCKLNKDLHQSIIETAVQEAASTWNKNGKAK